MNLKVVACLGLVLGFAQSSMAADSIVGKWMLAGQECSSGAPAKNVLNGLGSVSMNVTVDATTLVMDAQISMKIDQAKADAYIQQIDQAITQIAQQPDSPQKQQALQQAADAKAQILKYASGVQCATKSTANYSLVGVDQIQTTVTAQTSTCEGTTSNDIGKTSITKYSVSGNVLKVANETAETSPQGACPVGDVTTSVFARQP